jgi:hypothetical protein
MLDTFDAPRMDPNCELRASSTVAPQSLMLMNGTFAVEQSDEFSRRVLAAEPDDCESQVQLAWRIAFSSVPSDLEVHAAVEFLAAQADHFQKTGKADAGQPAAASLQKAQQQAFATFCQALLSSNAFLYVE